jgi:hypothetical protein
MSMSPPRLLLGAALPLFIALAGAASTPPADEAEQADAQFLQEYHAGADGPALLAFFRQRTPTPADQEHFRKLIAQLGDARFAAREEASRELGVRGPAVLPLLRPAANHPDPEVARRARACVAAVEHGPGPLLPAAAARMLARRAPPGAVPALLAYAPFADDAGVEDEVAAALSALAARTDAVDPALAAALTDTVSARRGAAAYALGRHPAAARRESARRLLADPEPAVRFRAAQGLLSGKDRAAVPALIALLAEAPADLATRAEDLLAPLAEDGAPPAPADATSAARRAHRDAWERWWRGPGKDVDLARLGEAPPYLGLTVIAQSDVGKVWECGRDGKPRWTIDGLQAPIEAQVLPGGRVLVVENVGQRVSERNTRGKILWDYKTPDNALSARRLPNGHTFVVTNSTVSEVTRAGRELYRHRFPAGAAGGRVDSACRLPGGRLLVFTSDGLMSVVDAATGKVVKAEPAPGPGCYSTEPLPGGGCLVASYGANKVVELDRAGNAVWEYGLPGAFHATRLPGGHTLIASHAGRRVVEVTRDRKVVWERAVDGNVWRAFRR